LPKKPRVFRVFTLFWGLFPGKFFNPIGDNLTGANYFKGPEMRKVWGPPFWGLAPQFLGHLQGKFPQIFFLRPRIWKAHSWGSAKIGGRIWESSWERRGKRGKTKPGGWGNQKITGGHKYKRKEDSGQRRDPHIRGGSFFFGCL